MKGALSLKTAPTIEPITLAEAKAQAKVETAMTDDDAYINSLITAARKHIENITGVCMCSQTWYYYLDGFPAENILTIPIGPVTAISSVKYTPSVGDQATFSASTGYETDLVSLPARIALKDGQSWPTDTLTTVNGVCVEFVAGYAAASAIVSARAALTAAEALVAAAVTAPEIAAAQVALASAAAGVSSAEAAELTAIPDDLRAAVKLLVAHWYEHRLAVTGAESGSTLKEMPLAVDSILNNYRMWQREA